MTEVRLFYIRDADRWEAIPMNNNVHEFISDRGVQILLDEFGVAIGFVADVDGDLESRIDVLRRYINVDSIEANLRSHEPDSEGVVIQLTGRVVSSSTPALVPMAVGSRVLRTTQMDRGIAVTVSISWWFAFWGMWFTVTRGDGLVLADLPIRHGAVEIVPNAFPVASGDLRASMHRGPKTMRRVSLLCVVLIVLVMSVFFLSDETSVSEAPVSVPSTDSVLLPPSTNIAPTITLPMQRRAATNYVSIDDVASLDVLIEQRTIAPGMTFNIQLLFDKSAFDVFGSLRSNGDQTEAFRSCQSARDFYREVPTQLGAREQFNVFLVSENGERSSLAENEIQMKLVGATVEGCPEAKTTGTDPYRVLQRTFYAPETVPITIPAEVEFGSYSIVVEVTNIEWRDAQPIEVVVGSSSES
jgi:hypothetical protein